jgi:DNA-binding MarR family transcriptional regulator
MWRTYREMYRSLESALDRELTQDSGLSGADYAILVPLSESPDGALRSRELRGEMNWDRTRLAHQLRRMEERGLLVRESCAEDARGMVARLTPAGREVIEKAAPGHVAAVRRFFIDQLSPEELDTMRTVADKVLARLREAETGQ